MEIVKDDEWGLYPHFTRDEMKCKHTGFCYMTHAFMKTLEDIREAYGKPMVVSSGYRDVSHPSERSKKEPGEHTYGMAADILVEGAEAIKLLKIIMDNGVQRIGLNQKSTPTARYIHIGIGDRNNGMFPVSVWTY